MESNISRHLLFALAERPLHLFALRDIDDGGDDFDAVGSIQGAEPDFDREFAAVLVQAEQIAPNPHRASCSEPRQEHVAMMGVLPRDTVGQQHVDLSSKQLLARVAEDLFRLEVDQFDHALAVDHDHRGRRGFGDLPESVLQTAALRYFGLQRFGRLDELRRPLEHQPFDLLAAARLRSPRRRFARRRRSAVQETTTPLKTKMASAS